MSQLLKGIRGLSFIELAILITVGGLCVVLAMTVAIISRGEHGSGIQLPVLWRSEPMITLDPKLVWAGTSISVRGEGWTPNTRVVFYLTMLGESQPPSHTVDGPTTDSHGRFLYELNIPSEPGWQGPGLATLTAQAAGGTPEVQEFFAIRPITGPIIGQVGESLRFDATGSKDGDGAIEGYIWGFGDGTTGSGVSVDHIYKNPGSYKVTLTVTDNGGLTDTATFEVEITPISPNWPPMAVINGTNSELWGQGQSPDGTSTSVSVAGTGLGQE